MRICSPSPTSSQSLILTTHPSQPRQKSCFPSELRIFEFLHVALSWTTSGPLGSCEKTELGTHGALVESMKSSMELTTQQIVMSIRLRTQSWADESEYVLHHSNRLVGSGASYPRRKRYAANLDSILAIYLPISVPSHGLDLAVTHHTGLLQAHNPLLNPNPIASY